MGFLRRLLAPRLIRTSGLPLRGGRSIHLSYGGLWWEFIVSHPKGVCQSGAMGLGYSFPLGKWG